MTNNILKLNKIHISIKNNMKHDIKKDIKNKKQ